MKSTQRHKSDITGVPGWRWAAGSGKSSLSSTFSHVLDDKPGFRKPSRVACNSSVVLLETTTTTLSEM